MKILYISVHSTLEYDELRMFLSLGHEVFSLHGAYQLWQGDGKRPPIDHKIDTHLVDIAMQCSREKIHEELCAWADVIFFMHRTDWIKDNWDKMKGKKVVLRTIGQNTEHNERDIEPLRRKGLKIVRMSETEKTIPNYQGDDAIIRFYKDEDEFNNWQGNTIQIVNVSQAMFGNEKVHSRGDHMSIDVFRKIVDKLPWKIFGPDNENAENHNGGILSYEDMKNMLRFNRVFLYTGTEPSPYTLSFIEAMMCGIPIVALGMNLWNTVYTNQKTYEIPKIIINGLNGYISDSIDELRGNIDKLLNDQDLARRIGQQGRMDAIKYFGKSSISSQWKKFFETL